MAADFGLTPGTRFGAYEILAPVGAGGMGEVHRARDTRLQRDVAIKILSASFAGDPARRARFEREAQAIAALSHPNILAIYDTGLHDGQIYLVMELLHGETLRDRLRGGALPPRKAVEIGVQVARGLAAAHANGIVHRDLKPENLFLLADGQVKILDFGLASAAAGTAESATQTVRIVTDPGTVMGTVGYMAPEQIRGQTVDQRADLFALGAVLYEMLSGQRAFKRETPAETMTAILNEDPPELAATRSDLPAAVERILRHALEKNVNERFQTARDVAFALEALSGSSPGTASGVAPVAAVRRSARWPKITAAALVLVAIAGIAGYRLGHSGSTSPLVFERKTFEPLFLTNARFMPDGAIAYSAARTGTAPELFVLRQGSVVPQPLGLSDTHLLSVSSKGELAILTGAVLQKHRVFDGTLARLSVGGAPRSWIEHVNDADWSPDGSAIAVIQTLDDGPSRLEYPAGTRLYEANGYLSDIRVSPDGTRVAFFEHRFRYDDRGSVKVVDRSKKILSLTGEYWGVEGLAWTTDGSALVYGAAAGQTPAGLEIYIVPASGGGAPRIAAHTMASAEVYDVAGDGSWLIAGVEDRTSVRAKLPGEARERDLSWLDHSYGVSLSHDGRLLAFGDENWSAGPDYATSLRTTDGAPAVRLGPGNAMELSPDGKWVAAAIFSTDRLVVYPTGAGTPRTLDVKPSVFHFDGWFPDSASVLLCGGESGAKGRCYRQPIAGGAMTAIASEGSQGAVLPDGRVAIASEHGSFIQDPDGRAAPIAIKALDPGDEFVAFASDSASAFFYQRKQVPTRLYRVSLISGARTPILEIGPQDQTGVIYMLVNSVIADGKGYLYTVYRSNSTLFVLTGAR
ncbi:MAG TPA: protein kinase [Vicinamibacterales bacterium]